MGFLIFAVVAIGLVVGLSAAASRRSTHRRSMYGGTSRWGGLGGDSGGTDAVGWNGDFGGGGSGGDGGGSGGGGGDGGGGGGGF
ncbi:hypothetical protein [Streptomyces sp. MAR4 CNX-425]|uniref:hypothetical protein n=1 Tax=Streptomyces sp. MAR4 CNX-425 TaxID=3406343 RepID=UPI003B502923